LTRQILTMCLFFLIALGPLFCANVVAQQRTDLAEMVILYAHTDYRVSVKGGNILSTAPPYGQSRSAILDREINFTLYPSLTKELETQGSVNYRLYLRSPSKRAVHLNLSLFEVDVDGVSKHVSSALVALPVADQISQYILGIPLSHTFSKDSTILFSIIPSEDASSLVIFWDGQQTDTYVALPIRGGFNVLDIQALDSRDTPIAGANVTILAADARIWTGRTDNTGWVRALLPKGTETTHQIIVRWGDQIVNETFHNISGDSKIQLECNVYSLELFVRDLVGSPVEGATVTLLTHGTAIGEGKTAGDGGIRFAQLPESAYNVEVRYDLTFLIIHLPTSQNITLQLSSSVSREVVLQLLKPWIINSGVAIFLMFVTTTSAATLLRRRKRSVHEYDFSYFDLLTGGGIPPSSSVMISGLPGSGKTILSTQLLIKSLRGGNPCIFITNLDYPSNLRRDLKTFEPNLEQYEKSSKLIFIDCYSASGGQASPEDHKVSAVGDLTGLGVQVSTCLDKLGQNTDVFIDSLTPLFTMLRNDYIANFVHSVGAKTKGIDGRFFYTLGTGIEKEGLNTIEAVSDCVIETSSTEESGEYHRRMRIKKMKKKHVERWTEFRVDGDKGIVFRSSRAKAVA
jgi:KaiC/GvpD/RAD55 family RecA-like ATPase